MGLSNVKNSIQKCYPLIIFILLLLMGMPIHAEDKVGASGAVGGANSQGANSQLESCTDSLGTLAVHEDQSANWWHN